MKVRVGIDIDGVISSEYSNIFSVLTQCFRSSDNIEVFIITSRENSEHSRRATEEELRNLGIAYDHLIISDNKQKVVKASGINLLIDNQAENFKGLKPDICCMLVRENLNYCWKTHRFFAE